MDTIREQIDSAEHDENATNRSEVAKEVSDLWVEEDEAFKAILWQAGIHVYTYSGWEVY